MHPSVHNAPVALVVHGTGSNPDFVRRTFSQATHDRGYSLASYRLRGHGPAASPPPYDFALHLNDLDSIIADLSPQLLGGISLGAHLSASWAIRAANDTGSVQALLLALPAWTGAPDTVAAANAHQADELAEIGTAAALERLDDALAGSSLHWVWEEMQSTWPEHDEAYFKAILRATAASHAPTLQQLSTLTVPVGIASSIDDPLHPLSVGEAWAAAIPRAALRTQSLQALGRDRGLLGTQAWSALDSVSESR